jgi:hypothetical protein
MRAFCFFKNPLLFAPVFAVEIPINYLPPIVFFLTGLVLLLYLQPERRVLLGRLRR